MYGADASVASDVLVVPARLEARQTRRQYLSVLIVATRCYLTVYPSPIADPGYLPEGSPLLALSPQRRLIAADSIQLLAPEGHGKRKAFARPVASAEVAKIDNDHKILPFHMPDHIANTHAYTSFPYTLYLISRRNRVNHSRTSAY